MGECVVCLEGITRKMAIRCPQCDVECHSGCVQEHLLHTVLDPHCPNCRKDWSHDFLAQFLSKSWRLGVFKTHRENVLIDRERSLLPDTQEAAAIILRDRQRRSRAKEIRPQIALLRVELRDTEYQLRDLLKEDKKREDEETEGVRGRKLDLRDRISALQREMNPRAPVVTAEGEEGFHAPEPAVDRTKRREFVYPCPAPDCRGFLSTQWKCKICDLYTCSKCGDLILDDNDESSPPQTRNHECDEDTKASFQLIRKESKGCPNCGVPITKISGCDHMFCIDCKTSFSWRTGEIHPRGNTNPLYWQWVEKNGGQQVITPRADGDPCGSGNIIANILRVIRPYIDRGHIRRLIILLEQLPHMENIDMRHWSQTLNSDEFRDLRVKYILKDITEDEWRVAIQRVEKKQRKARYIVNIFELFIRGSLDILRRFEATDPDYEALSEELNTEIEQLRELCNLELVKVGTIFASTIYLIGRNFTLLRTH